MREVGFDFEAGHYERELSEGETEAITHVEPEIAEAEERERERQEAREAIADKPDGEPVTAGELRAAGLV